MSSMPERLTFGEVEILVKASAATTGGALTVFEENEPVDTPLHVHEHEDELFYVLEGEHVIQVGEREHWVGPGELVFAPRGIPHAQRRVVPRRGRTLVLTAPGGLGASSASSRRRTPTARSARRPTRGPRSGTGSPGFRSLVARRAPGAAPRRAGFAPVTPRRRPPAARSPASGP
jgi:mannose-6-phosphate isomerase-like protein (cupin superfamily)